MKSVYGFRRKFGECFVTSFPGGINIPWSPLSLGDFKEYDFQFATGRLPLATLEDEIFCKQVLDENVVLNIDNLDAGIISTVVTQIMEASGPATPLQLAPDLDYARADVTDFFDSAIAMICQTFPAYKVSEVYDMEYKEVMRLIAMAESRLLAMGLLQEPLMPTVRQADDQEEYIAAPQAPRREQPVFRDLNVAKPKPKKNKNFVVAGGDGTLDREIAMSLPGHDQADKELWKRDALEGLEFIYPEYFAAMKEGEHITPDLIRETRGTDPNEIAKKHNKYTKDMLDGKLEHKPSDTLIAWDRSEGAKRATGKLKVKRKR